MEREPIMPTTAPEPIEVPRTLTDEELENNHRAWYSEKAHPWAIKRAQLNFQVPWVLDSINKYMGHRVHILDVGCGGGVLSNALGVAGHDVTGVDLSDSNIKVAERSDTTQRVKYVKTDSYHLPFPEECFDVVTALNVFCQVDNPQYLLEEITRVLRPGGYVFFHAFNQNLLSFLAIAKGTEWFIKNSPRNTHNYSQFIDPIDFEDLLEDQGLELIQLKGLRPALNASVLKTLWTREIEDNFKFKWSGDFSLSYAGCAKKLRSN